MLLPDFGDPAAFQRGYGTTDLTEQERRRRQLYGLHLTLIMIVETVYREIADPVGYLWARDQLDQTMALFAFER